MEACFIYLKLELKRMGRVIPHFLMGAIVLACLLGTIALSASRVLYGEASVGRIEVGVVLPDDDSASRMAVKVLEGMESVKSLCDFVYLDEEEGIARLRQGRLYAVLLVPDGFVQGIMNGTNLPMTILLPANPGVETQVFKELADAGARTLSAAQAAIYAADDYCVMEGMADAIPQVEADLNQIFMRHSLTRMEYYRTAEVSATGDVGQLEYYAISSSVLLLFLCGIPAASFLRPDRRVLGQKLRLLGVRPWVMAAARILSVFCLLLLPAMALLAGGALAGWISLSPAWAAAAALSCLLGSVMIVLIYELAGSLMAGVLALFFTVFIMFFLSGGFLPSVFLPEALRSLGDFMPSGWLIGLVRGAFTESFSWGLAAWVAGASLAGWSAVSLLKARD